MSERSKQAGNSLLECTCRSEMPEILVNPIMIIIAVVSYMIFALYYMVIVRDIRVTYGLPPHFIITVYSLVLIGLLMALAIVCFMIVRDSMHTAREARLRVCMIGYLEARHADLGLTDRTDLDRLVDADAGIFASEHPVTVRRAMRVFLLLLGAMFATVFVPALNLQLGEVSMALMIWMLAIGQLTHASVTGYPRAHEDAFLRFYGIFREAAAPLGVATVPYPSTVPVRDHRRMAWITVCTLGIGSLYWGCVVLRDMNAHFRSHRQIENRLVEAVWVLETGHAYGGVRG